MSAIQVENLGKRYIIGHQKRNDTLRDALSHGLSGLWQRLRNRRMTKEDFWALRDLNFTINSGEVVGIIGRNGAGKSTLLKVLSRITEPTTGTVSLRGRIASLLEVGTGFHPELSGRENIFLNGAILGMNKGEIRRKFDEIVAFAEVDKFLDTPVKRYSSGMYVRLAFAVAAHLEPEILIVDEVLAVGDAEFQKKCLGKMNDVARGGRTVIFVSHNLAAVQSLCDRAILLKAGSKEFDGTTSQAAREYLTLGYSSDPNKFHGDDPALACREIVLTADSEESTLSISLALKSTTHQSVGIEFILSDDAGTPVAFADAGSLNPNMQFPLTPAATELSWRINTRGLANGSYFLAIQLVQEEKGVLLRYDYPVMLKNSRMPQPPNRKVLHQDWQAGTVHLPIQSGPKTS